MPVQNFKTIDANNDVTTTRTLLHEAVPLTGTIVSGTYGTFPNGNNIKNFSHGMFQSVYDYPYLSSSANHIFDITCGFATSSVLVTGVATNPNMVQQSKKINMYTQYAQVLLGYTGSTVETFESDLNYADDNRQMKECFFINFSRLLMKDQIKPGTFSISLGGGSAWNDPFSTVKTLTDASASSDGTGTKNTNGGDYAVLYSSSAGTHPQGAVGLVFYQAGIVVLSSSCFSRGTLVDFYKPQSGLRYPVSGALVSASISGNCDAIRHRLQNVSFNNTTEINSTVYFCRVPFNSYNYSSNPTYTDGSKIRIKSVATDMPISYITTVGLYNASDELVAVAKVSEPLRKDPTNELTLRVRLDY